MFNFFKKKDDKRIKIALNEWDVDIDELTAEIDCPCCENLITVDVSDIMEKEVFEVDCDFCDAPLKCEVDFYLSDLY